MPVWHALTRDLRAAGELEVVGIVQEQHPERARLYAAWQGLDFPVLWDPFNVVGVRSVLVASLVDEHGVVRATRLRPDDVDAFRALLGQAFPAPGSGSGAPAPWTTPALGRQRIAHPPGSLDAARAAVSRALWAPDATAAAPSGATLDGVVLALETRLLEGTDVAAADHFRAGVARRLRHDSAAAKAGDLQASIDHWVAALALDPGQYIWRRRIQQWGPRLDKPYPFYDWVAQAQPDLEERGTPAPPLGVALSGSEVAGQTRALPRLAEPELAPDPERRVPRDEGALVRIEVGAAPSSRVADPDAPLPVGTARVHVALDPLEGAHWTPDTEPPIAWIVVPQGWSIDRNLHTFALPPGEAPAGPTTVDFEVAAPSGVRAGTLRGFALYSVCDADDVCTFRRQDFAIPVRVRRDAPDAPDVPDAPDDGGARSGGGAGGQDSAPAPSGR